MRNLSTNCNTYNNTKQRNIIITFNKLNYIKIVNGIKLLAVSPSSFFKLL